jgi:hypothetical protein
MLYEADIRQASLIGCIPLCLSKLQTQVVYYPSKFLTCICLTARRFRMTLAVSQAAQVRDVTPGPLTVTDTCIMYHLTNFDAS